MKFEAACKKAMRYFEKEYGDTGLISIMDLGDKWLFDGANEDSSVVYGKQCITIDKDTGEREIFYLPNDKNFELLENVEKMIIPENYRLTI